MNNIIKKFLIRAALIYLVWVILYYGFILPEGSVNSYLTSQVLSLSVATLNMLGFESSGMDQVIYINGAPQVLVGDGCNGLELFVLYIGFILAFPGKIGPKIAFLPIGFILIFMLNILREVGLALNYFYNKNSFDFNHKYTYVLVIYLAVFSIWRYWLKKYSVVSNY